MNNNTLLLRQINPSFLKLNRPTSQAFRPTPKDEYNLSVYDGDKIKSEPAWEHFTGQLNFASVGVMGITVEECTELDLSARSDPVPFLEHAIIDFSSFSKNQIEKKARKLQEKAVARGWLYQATASQVGGGR
ncbi:MAG: hypothetical protein HQL07_03795 [Nitrospirae bacterium]|nr:hypothetical protein [Magnetococcales bacterium]HAT48843.1 hypothetical protein [Alphaproteobacteria bacterium]